LGIKEKKGLNAEFAEETQRALRREEIRREERPATVGGPYV